MKKRIILAVSASVVMATFFMSGMVFADGGGSEGVDPTGGNCGEWWDTCNGYSWQKYKVTVPLEQQPEEGLHVFTTTNAGPVVYIKGCKEGMIIYNYGFEVANAGYRGYQVSTQKNKSGKQADWIYPLPTNVTAKGALDWGSNNSGRIAGNIQDYTEPVGYISNEEAKDKFDDFSDYIREHPNQNWDLPAEGLDWKDVGAFCWFEENPVDTPEFYSQSQVEAQKISGSDKKTADTGIVGVDKESRASNLSVEVNSKVKVTFTHNLYSTEKVDKDKSWSVTRSFSSGTTMSGGSGRNSGATKFTELSNKSIGNRKLYIANTRQYSGNVLRDEYTITFANSGYYEFCESVKIDGLTTTACASVSVAVAPPLDISDESAACGWPAPASYTTSKASSGVTSVISRVRSLTLTNQYRDFQDAIYAKPNDTVEWCNAYYPGAQKAAGSTVTHDNDDPHPYSLGEVTTNTLNNHAFSDYLDWTNKFDITSRNVQPYYSYSASYDDGMSEAKGIDNKAQVKVGQAGQTLSETITTGSPATASITSVESNHGWRCNPYPCTVRCGKDGKETCPSTCEKICRHSNTFYGNSHSGTASDTSYVKVPYNFKNTATVRIREEASQVYAGETVTIDYSRVMVNRKQNNITQGSYATQVNNAQTRLVGYLSSSNSGTAKDNHLGSNICSALPVKNGSCNLLRSYSGKTFNSGADMGGSTDNLGFAGQSYNVYDAKAGDYFCVVVAVYPSTSGVDTNINASGDGRWYISKPSCSVIAKRPSFQVWGGGIYSEKSIKTSSAPKNNLAGVYSYTVNSKLNTVVFGSWVEQTVIANGLVNDLASGAATGDVTAAHGSGSKEGSNPNYCSYRVPLSIANWSTANLICPNAQQTGNAQLSNVAIDRDALIDYWNVSGSNYVNKTSINLAADYIETTTMQGNRVNYTEVSGGLSQVSLVGATIRKGNTHVMRTSGNIRIDGNIIYENTTYRSQKEIPKAIIYAGGDIVINCGVSRIDAIIIAGGRVTTCDSYDVNSSRNSNQLKVNGMIISDSLVLNRTYGAKTGTGSGLPAEIINYDTSAIIWGKGMATTTDSDALTTVYQHEIAPRY